MSHSIIPQLIKKDFDISRAMIMRFSVFSLASIVLVSVLIGRIPDVVLLNIALILLIGPVATCGLVLVMKSNVFEKEKSTQPFIMSLPVTVREFTIAKVLVNLMVFGVQWLVVTIVAFYFCFGMDLLPLGAAPFLTMLMLGILVAYTCILSISLLFQSLGPTVSSIVGFQLLTAIYLWIIVFLDPIGDHIYGNVSVWNTTAISIIAIQILVVVAVIALTMFLQGKKRDFV